MLFFIPRRYSTPKWQARILAEDKQFRFQDGHIASSLYELKHALNTVSDGVLEFHVNASKHDLADWVQHVVGDTELAAALRKTTHRWGLIVALERGLMRTLNMPPYVAKRWLKRADFPMRFQSGEEVYTLDELAKTLEKVSDDTIEYHMQRVPNDIASWVLEEVGDYELAELLDEASNRLQMHRFVVDHVDMLKDAAED